ncbi:tripartite tricarboxylate transporter TctB family protein [Chloroflexota bacterium]
MKFGSVLIWLVGFWAAIYIVGFIVAIPSFILAYMKTRGVSWLTSIISAVVITGIVYAVFIQLFNIHLYEGLIYLKWIY